MTTIGVRTGAISWIRAVAVAVLVLVGCAIAKPAGASTVNLVQNGNFTSTTVTGSGGYLCVNSGSTCTSQLTGWSATCSSQGCSGDYSPSSILMGSSTGSGFNNAYGGGDNALYWNGTAIAPPLGGNVVAIDGDPKYTSVLSQTVTGLNVGQSYVLQFYQASSEEISFTGPTTEQWQVSLGGGTAQTSTLMTTPNGSYTGWTLQTMTFIASAVSETLQFAALGTPAGEPPVVLLGDVSLVQQTNVPEPMSAALLAAGLVGVVAVRGRRKA
jgi:hypothetical protein